LAHFIVNVHIPVGCDWFYHRKKLVEGEENIFCIPKVNFSIISYGNCISNTVTELKLMVNATFDSFSLVGRIATLPSSIGDCESLTEVCSFYDILPIPASYVFQRTILNT